MPMAKKDNNQWREGALRYVYVDPKRGSINYGDNITDYAVRLLLSRYLPAPAAEHDSHTPTLPSGNYDFMVLPGVTMLTDGTRPGLARIGQLPYPAYCLSGNIWARTERPGWLLRTRVISRKRIYKPTLHIARQLSQPVGARDPYTHRYLVENGISSLYTGCPTLLLPAAGTVDDGYVLFSFSRGHVRYQVRAAHRLAKTRPVVGICHEKGDLLRYRAAGFTLPLVDFQDDVELYLSYFRRASLVISGRLHGVLPSLAFGKKVFYYGTRDSRTTILDDLGVTIHPYCELGRAVELASGAYNRFHVQVFRERWDAMLTQIVLRHTPHRESAVREEGSL